jgi:hypothetical protein
MLTNHRFSAVLTSYGIKTSCFASSLSIAFFTSISIAKHQVSNHSAVGQGNGFGISVTMGERVNAQSCSNNDIRSTTQNIDLNLGGKWSTCNNKYVLVMQDDGNLVLYNQSRNPIWATGTEGRGKRLSVQTDGNVVLYDGNNKPLWASNTDGNPNSIFSVQSDGNLVVYRKDGQPIWSSKTDGGRNSTRSASAEWSKTRSTASIPSSTKKIREFRDSIIGARNITRPDLGPDYNGHCVTLIARYLQKYYGAPTMPDSLSLGNGRDTARVVSQRFSNSFLSLSDPSAPIPGTVISFLRDPKWGHVALVLDSSRSGNKLTVKILESNANIGAPANTTVTERTITIDFSNPNNPQSISYLPGAVQWTNPRD